ncbi:MAG: hypothetical protein HBSAPP02_09020 [Phycisphaerae bacterium]|nr:MAG: hypothetical protein HRU71_13205 [Planctomycetia bacterium]RIK71527.1 MAG: hypothetical protein DCC66_00900 [Planctomycetota bacterium]GJQ25870.1 MAG: hypothetical protein HBSAPP02_09020 [Phycisphaerae bacterium]
MRPPRPPFALAAALIAVALAGCENKPEPRRTAQTAVAGLMPAGQPGYDEGYVIDQAQVKTAPARKVSYEPFESFRKKSGATAARPEGAANESGADADVTPAKPRPAAARPASAGARPAAPRQMPPGAGGGFWQRVGMKTLAGAMGGPPPAGATQPPAATEEAAGEDDSESDDSDDKASSDEDESEDGSDDGEASNDESEEEEKSDDDGD